MTEDTNYYDIPALSNSQIQAYLTGGIRKWGKSSPFSEEPESWEDTVSKMLGRLLHTLILQPERLELDYIISGSVNRRTNAGKEEYKQMQADGRTIVSDAMLKKAKKMAERLNTSNMYSAMLNKAVEREKMLLWEEVVEMDEEEFKIPCKALVDAVVHIDDGSVILNDLKSTESFVLEAPYIQTKNKKDRVPTVMDICLEYGYHRQAAWYIRGYERTYGVKPTFHLIMQDKGYIKNIGMFEFSEDLLQKGHEEIEYALPRLGRLIKNQQFTEFPQDFTKNGIITIG